MKFVFISPPLSNPVLTGHITTGHIIIHGNFISTKAVANLHTSLIKSPISSLDGVYTLTVFGNGFRCQVSVDAVKPLKIYLQYIVPLLGWGLLKPITVLFLQSDSLEVGNCFYSFITFKACTYLNSRDRILPRVCSGLEMMEKETIELPRRFHRRGGAVALALSPRHWYSVLIGLCGARRVHFIYFPSEIADSSAVDSFTCVPLSFS